MYHLPIFSHEYMGSLSLSCDAQCRTLVTVRIVFLGTLELEFGVWIYDQWHETIQDLSLRSRLHAGSCTIVFFF